MRAFDLILSGNKIFDAEVNFILTLILISFFYFLRLVFILRKYTYITIQSMNKSLRLCTCNKQDKKNFRRRVSRPLNQQLVGGDPLKQLFVFRQEDNLIFIIWPVLYILLGSLINDVDFNYLD